MPSKTKLLITLAFCILGPQLICEAREPAALYSYIEQLFGQIEGRGEMSASMTRAQRKDLFAQADPNQLLTFLGPYLASRNVGLKSAALEFEMNVAEAHPRRAVRARIVDSLTRGLVSQDKADRGLRWKYSASLSRFTQDEFTEGAKASLVQALRAERPSKEILWVCGVAQVKETLPRLNELVFDEIAYARDPSKRNFPEWYFTLGWYARLARARMGEQADVEKALAAVDTVTDHHIKVTLLLRHVAYIRRPEAMDYLKKYFLSDETLAPTNPGMPREPVSKFLMPFLAESLLNFPFEPREIGEYTNDEVETAKKWVSAQTTWQIRR
jgi:hypothetical protein